MRMNPPFFETTHTGSVWLEGSDVYHDGRVVRPNYCRSTERLAAGDRVVVRCHPGGAVSFVVGDIECARIATGLRESGKVWPLVGLSPAFSSVTAVTQTSEHQQVRQVTPDSEPVLRQCHETSQSFSGDVERILASPKKYSVIFS